MEKPYFPVNFKNSFKNAHFHLLTPERVITIGGVTVTSKKMKHPGNSYSFSVTENGKKFIYATDVEISNADFSTTEFNSSFFKNASAIVMDSQYTVEEAMHKANWGHSPFCYAIDFADAWKIKNLYLFHHEPTYDDEKIDFILRAAQQYSESGSKIKVVVRIAAEGMSIDI
jgi:phosphoribosyl 1,2-cyclic phosphodiesterase